MAGVAILLGGTTEQAPDAQAADALPMKVCKKGIFTKPDQAFAQIGGSWGPDAQIYVKNLNVLGVVGSVSPSFPVKGNVTTFALAPSQSKTFPLPLPGQLVTYIPQSNGVSINADSDAANIYWEVRSSVCDTDEYIWNTTLAAGSSKEPSSGSRLASVTVKMGRPVLGATSISYNTSAGTATPNQDYTPKSGLLTFKKGEQTKTITIPILADALVEGEEFFNLNLDGNASPTNPSTVLIANPKVTLKIPITDGTPTTSPNPPAPATNRAPTAAFTSSRVDGTPGKVSLDASASSDPDGTLTKYEWLYKGAVIATGRTASYAFGSSDRAPAVSLRVTDNGGNGGAATATTTKTLSLPNRAPSIVRPNPADGTIVGSNRPNLSTTVTDPDGDPLSFNYRITGYMVDKSSGWISGGWTVPASTLDPGTKYTWSVSVTDNFSPAVSASRSLTVAMLPTAADVISTPSGKGYWQVASDGGVFTYGDAQFYGSVPGIPLKLTNIMGMARTPSGKGYWVVGSDGGVFSFGDAGFYGSLPGQNTRVNNVVDMVPTKTGRGYWLVASDGGVFSFGDAQFFGSMGGQPLNRPVVGMSATASGNGYWLVAADGGIFSFGDAPFYGSMGGQPLSYPVVDMDVTPDGGGYWMTAEDGGVFSFGDAQFYGSMGGKPLNGHVTGMAVTPTGKGYWLNACDGGIFTFGDAPFYGANPTYMCRGTNQP